VKRKNPIEFKCDRCGKPQPKNETASSKNWNVYDSNQKCECGGTFKMCFNGKPLNEETPTGGEGK
jgi:hypothetical protein